MIIKEGMAWPPLTHLTLKMQEHSAWYSGDENVIANYYNDVHNNNPLGMNVSLKDNKFWKRQVDG